MAAGRASKATAWKQSTCLYACIWVHWYESIMGLYRFEAWENGVNNLFYLYIHALLHQHPFWSSFSFRKRESTKMLVLSVSEPFITCSVTRNFHQSWESLILCITKKAWRKTLNQIFSNFWNKGTYFILNILEPETFSGDKKKYHFRIYYSVDST